MRGRDGGTGDGGAWQCIAWHATARLLSLPCRHLASSPVSRLSADSPHAVPAAAWSSASPTGMADLVVSRYALPPGLVKAGALPNALPRLPDTRRRV